ncbi:MAG: hypothetical protein MK214_02945 [Thalassotalea sp.]|nr:hypothetical protein [Thalassotalea sp.]
MIILKAIQQQISGESLTSQVVAKYVEQEMEERLEIHYTPKHLHTMAVEHFTKMRLKPALDAIEKAIKLAPTNVKFRISLLKILLAMDKAEQLEEIHLPLAKIAITMLDTMYFFW